MNRKTFIAALAGAAALVGAVMPAEARVIRTTVPVEYSAANRDHVRLAEQLQTLRTGARVELDLQLDLEAGAERVASLGPAVGKGRALRRSIEIGDEAGARIQEVTCLTDLNAPLNYTRQNYFRLKLFENFDHVVFKVYPGDKADFPMNDAACVFADDAPGKKRFHLRGRYQAIVNQTLRGVVVQLRPVR
jgi:hypothetical protein